MRIWNQVSGECVQSVDSGSQICSLFWIKNENQIVTSHGYIENDLCVWNSDSLDKVSVMRSHKARVISAVASPDQSVVCSSSSDQTIRFWRLQSYKCTLENPFCILK